MTFIKLEDTCPDHPAIVGLTDAAFACWVRGLCYSSRHLTDGLIPTAALRSLGTPKAARELVDAGRWIPVDTGWRIHGYEDHQRTRVQVERERELARDRQSRHRATTPVSRRDTPARNGSVTKPEVEVEVETEQEPPLPPSGVGQERFELVLVEPDPDALFNAWWSRYPKKVGKREARDQFDKALKRTTIDVLTAGLERSIASWDAEHRELKMVPDPARWLRRDRWEDEPLPAPRPPMSANRQALARARDRLSNGHDPLAALGPGRRSDP